MSDGVRIIPFGIEKLDLPVAQTFDVEGVARNEMPESLDGLGRADETARAAAYDVRRSGLLVDLSDGGRTAGRTGLGETIGFGTLGPRVEQNFDDLWDHVAGPLQPDRIADPHVLAADLVLIVQCRVDNHDATHRDRSELRDRRERARSADLDVDGEERGRGPFGRKLVCHGPARRPRHEAETGLVGQIVDLVDDAVDVIRQRGPQRFDLAIAYDQRLGGIADLTQGVRGKPEARESRDHAGLRRGREAARLAPGIGEEPQGPRCRDGRVELAQRSCGRVARIGKGRTAGFALARVEGREVVFGHEDLAAHLERVGHIRADKGLRDGRDGPDVGRDILTRVAVAPRGSADEPARHIPQRTGETVDLRFRRHGQSCLGTEPEETPHARDELGDLLVGEDIAERQHGHAMSDRRKLFGRLRTDRRARAFGRVEGRKGRFDGREAAPQRVVVGVRHRWCVVAMVGDIVARDRGRKPRMFGAGCPEGRRQELGFSHGSANAPGDHLARDLSRMQRRRG